MGGTWGEGSGARTGGEHSQLLCRLDFAIAPARTILWRCAADTPKPMPWSQLVELYKLSDTATPRNIPPRYNVAPTQGVPVVRRPKDANGRELVMIRWGLVPF